MLIQKPNFKPFFFGALLATSLLGSQANAFSSGGSTDTFTACKDLFPAGHFIDARKIDLRWHVAALCSRHFAVLNSRLTKTPLVVVERLNASVLADARGEERTNEFYPDQRLHRGERAELEDFKGSGYDRGHLANAADQPDQDSMIESFALSNMIPQDPFNNGKGAWIKAESVTRKFARRAQGDVFVFSGPLFRGEVKKIGPNNVWVPSHIFKLVYDQSSGRSWAHIVVNTAEARLEAPITYAEFVKETGWKLLGEP